MDEESPPARPLARLPRPIRQQVMPTVMSPKAAAVESLSRCIPPAIPVTHRDSPFARTYRDSPGRFAASGTGAGTLEVTRAADDAAAVARGEGRNDGTAGARAGSSGAASASASASSAGAAAAAHHGGVTDHLARTVPTSAAVIVYAFNAADRLVGGLLAATGSSGSATTGFGGDSDDHRKCVLLRAAAAAAGGGGGGGRGVGDSGRDSGGGGGGGGAGGFGPALEAGLSRPVLADEMGETHLWVVDAHGRRHLAAAFVSLQRATVFITLSASAQFPPFRVENRSSAETLAYRQVGLGVGVGVDGGGV